MLEQLTTEDGPLSRFVVVHPAVTVESGAATIDVTLKTWPHDRFPEVHDEIRRRVGAVPGARVEFPEPPFPAMVCSPELSHAAAAHLRALRGEQAVAVPHTPFPFSGEDFALLLHRAPGAMVYLGVTPADRPLGGVLHTPHFDPDEAAIGIGLRAMAGWLNARLHTR
jgi:metal-dependent amidase/aminoacylase/carboxypeptidase family protein